MDDVRRPSLRETGPGRLAAAAYAGNVRHAAPGDLWCWLAAGWRDAMATGGRSLVLGGLFALVLLVIVLGLPVAGWGGWVMAATAAALIVAPLPGCAFFAMSRTLEQGDRLCLRSALLAWRVAPGRLLSVGLVLGLAFLLWERFTTLIFALSVPNAFARTSAEAVRVAWSLEDALVFLVAIGIVAAVLTVALFIGGAMAVPLMFDRGVDIWTGLFVSVLAFFGSWKAMLGLALAVLGLTVAGLLMGVLGLAVTLPVAGHAVWHAYRTLVAWG